MYPFVEVSLQFNLITLNFHFYKYQIYHINIYIYIYFYTKFIKIIYFFLDVQNEKKKQYTK
jgi:hypothetical protein